jgi:hypothetical protein
VGEAGLQGRRTLNGSNNLILRHFVDDCIFQQVELLCLHSTSTWWGRALFMAIQFSFFFLYLVLSCFASLYGASNCPQEYG